MSLFVCMKCGAVENTNCCTPKGVIREDENGFPNKHIMAMHGFDKNYIETGIISEIEMLCSECNTGSWHGEFERKQANKIETLMANQLEDNIFTLHPLYKLYMRDRENFDIKILEEWTQAEEDFREDQRQLQQIKEKSNFTLKDYDFNNMWHEPCDPYVREEPKIGRNDSCLCGSSKKYKKCCMKNKGKE